MDDSDSDMAELDLTAVTDAEARNFDDVPGSDNEQGREPDDAFHSRQGRDDSADPIDIGPRNQGDDCSCERGCVSRTEFLQVREKAEKRKNRLEHEREMTKKLRHRLRESRAQNCQQPRRPERRTKAEWPRLLEKFLNNEPQTWKDDSCVITYGKILRLCAREENYSHRYVHPDLDLTGDAMMGEDLTHEEEEDEDEDEEHDENEELPNKGSSTRRLGLMIEALVLQHALRFNRGIHALSRLDWHYEPSSPDELPRNARGALTLPRRYHVGTRPCSITFSARHPNELLSPLLVCRDWHFMGSHIFYAQNQFLFSSLGELGRWCHGIGPKIALVSSMSLFLIGSQGLVYKPSNRGKYISRRSQPLMLLPQCLRLRELVIYVRETDRSYTRRKHETRGAMRYAAQFTEEQPAYRMARNLHTIQGLDYIRCLRGLVHLDFYDYDRYVRGRRKEVQVRDTDFVQTMRKAVLREKDLLPYVQSRLRSLWPLNERHEPSEEVWACLGALGVDIFERGLGTARRGGRGDGDVVAGGRSGFGALGTASRPILVEDSESEDGREMQEEEVDLDSDEPRWNSSGMGGLRVKYEAMDVDQDLDSDARRPRRQRRGQSPASAIHLSDNEDDDNDTETDNDNNIDINQDYINDQGNNDEHDQDDDINDLSNDNNGHSHTRTPSVKSESPNPQDQRSNAEVSATSGESSLFFQQGVTLIDLTADDD